MPNHQGRIVIAICSCGWFSSYRHTVRAATDAFHIHTLLASHTTDHLPYIEDQTPGTRSWLSQLLEGEIR